MPTPTIPAGNLFMNATLYTGTGSAGRTVTGMNFQPDFTWIKSRSDADSHYLVNSTAGYTKYLLSNSTQAEVTNSNIVTSSDSSGFTVGSSGAVNGNTATYVAWNWKAGGTAVTNNVGSISSQVSANTTSGFSVVTYTGNSSAAQTVGHGLGVTPSFITIKQRTASGNSWVTYTSMTGAGNWLALNLTQGSTPNTTLFNNTAPTSSVFTVGIDSAVNNTGQTYVAYCWAPIAGYSAFGSYTGNGSTNGPFVYLGFRPRFVMWKNSSAAEAWLIEDAARSTYNQVALELYPNSSGAEAAGSSRSPTQQFDFLSNGFKVRGAQEQTNGSGNTIIYAAFAEMPFKYANAR